jgi:hypothetical protein
MTATAQNIKRMVKILSRRRPEQEALAVTGLISISRLFHFLTQLTQDIASIQFD